MGSSDRDYFRDESKRHAGGGGPAMPPVTKALLIANLAIYFIDMLFLKDALTYWGAFTVQSAFAEMRLWELITFQFLHGSAGHVIFNSIGIYFFGPWAERWWGSRRFTAFYLLCGAAGALFFAMLTVLGILPERGPFPGVQTPLVGASAGIFGMIICVAVIAPRAMVQLLIPPVTMTLRTAAFCFIGLAVAVILGDIVLGWRIFENSGGEAGHLGGAILGYVLMRCPFLLGKEGGSTKTEKIIRPKEFRGKSKPKLRPRTSLDVVSDTEVDRILDKIAKDGLQSLTDAEREILHQAAQAHDER